MKHIALNFSLYILTKVEIAILTYGLDHYIPTCINKSVISIEFDNFFKTL